MKRGQLFDFFNNFGEFILSIFDKSFGVHQKLELIFKKLKEIEERLSILEE